MDDQSSKLKTELSTILNLYDGDEKKADLLSFRELEIKKIIYKKL